MEDVRVELPELQQYLMLGLLDENSRKKREQAIRNGKTYAYVRFDDYADMKRCYDLQQQGINAQRQHKNEDYTPRPKGVEVNADQETLGGKIVLGVVATGLACYIIAVLFLGSKPESIGNTSFVDTATVASELAIPKPVESSVESSLSAPPTMSAPSYSLESDIKSYFSGIDATYLDSMQDEYCFKIMVLDDYHDWDSVCKGLCLVTKRHGIDCFAIYDVKMNQLGKSFCN